MKAVNKKSFLLVIALALVFSLTVGLTLAYFSDYNAAKGESTIALGGKTVLHDKYTSDTKTVVIENTGDVPVVARVAVYAPILSDGQTVTVTGDDDWEKKGTGDKAHWYYTKVLTPKGTPGAKSSPLTVSTEYLLKEDLGDTVNVVVTHESSQIAYDENGNIIVPGEIPPGDWDKINYTFQ